LAELLTVPEVANYLRVTEKTVYRLLEKKSIPASRVGRQWRFEKWEIDLWLRQTSKEIRARILVVDDDEQICSLFKDILEEAGHKVNSAGSVERALQSVQDGDYDLVFLDLMLPGGDGAELFGQIKGLKPGLPVTIITGYPESELMMKALQHGPLGAMMKPFSGSDILNAVNNYVHFNRLSK
jgi:excisionase family DNA binding protein